LVDVGSFFNQQRLLFSIIRGASLVRGSRLLRASFASTTFPGDKSNCFLAALAAFCGAPAAFASSFSSSAPVLALQLRRGYSL
jgi:hypothetical protein